MAPPRIPGPPPTRPHGEREWSAPAP